jgi:membrane-associated PAP2 superfamily phosphatase
MTPSATQQSKSIKQFNEIGLIFISLLILLAWDVSGLDLWISTKFAGIQGFAWQHAWLTEAVLHRGGKLLYYVIFAMLAVNCYRPFFPTLQLPRKTQLWWFLTMLTCIAAISILKYYSLSSCPWDLEIFGGSAQHLSHWAIFSADGGPGRCFPSGHVSGAFSLLAISFALRPISIRAARWALVMVLSVGAILGAGQVARGAHFVSHVFYSGLICWVICLISARLFARFGPGNGTSANSNAIRSGHLK